MYSSQTIFLRSRGKNSSVVEGSWEVLYCLSEDRRVTSQDGNTLSLTDSRYQQTMCPWGKENVPDRLGVELCKAEILFHGSSLTSLPLLLLICPESFFFFSFFSFSFSFSFSSSLRHISNRYPLRSRPNVKHVVLFCEMMLGFRPLWPSYPEDKNFFPCL